MREKRDAVGKSDQQVDHLFVFLEIFCQEGGIQSYVKDILSAYTHLEPTYQAEVFLLRDSFYEHEFLARKNLKFHYFYGKYPLIAGWKFSLALFSCLISKRPQHVFCGHINLAVLIQSLCFICGIPYTVMTYGKEVWEPLGFFKRQALAAATAIWTISRYSRNRACVANNIDPNKVQILPCAIDGNKFTPRAKSSVLVQKYNLVNAKVLTTVARLWSGDIYKGVDVTIRALPKIIPFFPEVKYLVIGRGDDQPRLAQLANDLGVSDRVIFAGFVPTEELAAHYCLSDAYIMPSQEGFGIVYLEAMACGIPVLSGDNDGSSDPLQDGKLGWQVPHRDADAVALACKEILQGDDRRCNGHWLREQVLTIFGQEALQKRLAELLLISSR